MTKKAPKELIGELRSRYAGNEATIGQLQDLAEIVSENLQSEKEHFILELIQNADDNLYEDGISPELKISMKHIPFEGEEQNILIVENNEKGFQEENVRALCAFKKSTKINKLETTGEKGIGFKSVYSVTDCPYIFSNGYNFCLPKDVEVEGGRLSYIVPEWVEKIPEWAKGKNCIVLPIKKELTEHLKSKLNEIDAKTFLFLRQLRRIDILIDVENEYVKKDFSVDIDKKTKRTNLVSTEKNGVSSDVISSKIEYYFYEKEITKPEEIVEKSRKNVDKTIISFAFPLSDEDYIGDVFAFLPVHHGTGFPFAINADFILTANREEIIDNQWNVWIRDRIPEVLANAIEDGMNSPFLTKDEKIHLFSRMPVDTHYDFFRGPHNETIDRIFTCLQSRKIIPVFQSNEIIAPNDCKYALDLGYELLEELNWSPSLMEETEENDYLFPDVKIQRFELILEKLGCIPNTRQLVDCLSKPFLHNCSNEQLFKLFQYIMDNGFSVDFCSIIPINKNNTIEFVSSRDYAVYWEKPEEDFPIFEKQLEVRFVSNTFREFLFELFSKDDLESGKILKQRIEKYFGITSFTTNRYCNRLNDILAPYFHGESEDFMNITYYLIDNGIFPNCYRTNIGYQKFYNYQLISERMILVPADYNIEYGWQTIWNKDDSRNDFCYLIGYDKIYLEKILKHEKEKEDNISNRSIKEYPLFKVNKCSLETRNDLMYPVFEELTYHTSKARYKSYITYPEIYPELCSDNFNFESLFHFFSYWTNNKTNIPSEDFFIYLGLQYKTVYDNGSKKNEKVEYIETDLAKHLKQSKCIPTDKGLSYPGETYRRTREISTVFNDTVSYLSIELSAQISNFLGIHSRFNSETILDFLKTKKCANSNCSLEAISRIYQSIIFYDLLRQDNGLCVFIKNDNAIYIPEENEHWCPISDCIWNECDFLPGEYHYLSRFYDEEMKSVFIKMGVRESVPSDYYLELWKKEQNSNNVFDSNRVAEFYNNIYSIYEENIKNCSDKWVDFCSTASILTETGLFVERDKAFLSDNEIIKKCFVDEAEVLFVPKFGDRSLSSLIDFYAALGVKTLSSSTSVVMIDSVIDSQQSITDQYLTKSCIAMIATLFHEKHNSSYQSNLNKLQALRSVQLIACPSPIRVRYVLSEKFFSESTQSVYFDRANNLFYCYTSDNSFRRAISKLISEFVFDDTSFASDIELFLSEQSIDRILENNWHIPSEFQDLVEGSAVSPRTLSHTSSHLDFEDKNIVSSFVKGFDESDCNSFDKCEVLNNPEQSNDLITLSNTSSSKNKTNKERVIDAFHTPSKDSLGNLENEYSDDDSDNDFSESTMSSAAKERRREIKQQKYSNHDNEHVTPKPNLSPAFLFSKLMKNDEFKDLFNKLDLDIQNRIETPVDPIVKLFLFDQYHGKCQICGKKPFIKKDGNPFFITTYLVKRHDNGISDDGNAICLCPDCFAQWSFGEHSLNESDLDDAIRFDSRTIKFTLLGKEVRLVFSEKHFEDFKTFLES